MKNILQWLLPFALCVVFVFGRVTCYGPMNDSVAVQDSESYFETAEKASFSLEFFEQQRAITLPLLIHISNPSGEYELTHMSEPYFGTESRLAVQPGTENLVRNQTVISIVCWVAFALLAASSVNGWFAKALITLLILGCGFVPQVADWDSILSSESLSISLFVLVLGLLFKVMPDGKGDRAGKWIAVVCMLPAAFFWVFTRDTNSWFIIAAAIVLILAGIIEWVSRKVQNVSVLLCGFCLIGIFFFQQLTFRESERWLLPLLNNLTANVFPYEDRVEFFAETGMPTDEETLSATGSAEYNNIYENEKFLHWARRFGMETYQDFLLSMPLWSVLQVYENLDGFFEENRQPFFYGSDQERPHWAEKPGNFLHPLSAAVILIDLLLVIYFGCRIFRTGYRGDIRIFWTLLALFIGGGLLMSLSYLGEVRSVWRHVLGGVLALRLLVWLGLAALFSKPEEENSAA